MRFPIPLSAVDSQGNLWYDLEHLKAPFEILVVGQLCAVWILDALGEFLQQHRVLLEHVEKLWQTGRQYCRHRSRGRNMRASRCHRHSRRSRSGGRGTRRSSSMSNGHKCSSDQHRRDFLASRRLPKPFHDPDRRRLGGYSFTIQAYWRPLVHQRSASSGKRGRDIWRCSTSAVHAWDANVTRRAPADDSVHFGEAF